MADRILELTVFESSARMQSFSKASTELGMSQPSVSRIVADLEQRLGVKLFHRSTKMMTLTEAGKAFLGRARQILEDLEFADQIAASSDRAEGMIKLSLPPSYGARIIIPLLPRYLEKNPDVTFDVMMSNDRPDEVMDIADVAICLGDYSDSLFRVRRLAATPRLVISSPEYLKGRDAIQTPGDLMAHDLILGPGARVSQHWRFRREGVVSSVESVRRIEISSTEGVMAAIRAGLGIGIVPKAICRDELDSGAVVEVLGGYALSPLSVYAMSQLDKPMPSRVRSFVDFLATTMLTEPGH